MSICAVAALWVALAAMPGVGVQAGARQELVRPVELRGVWITNVDSAVLDSRASIAEAMDFLEAHHFKPGLVVSWAPSVFPFALDEYLQDWPAWVNGGYADIVHPQVYRRNIDDYRRTLDAQGAAALGLARQVVYPGVLINVGRYVVSDELLVQMVAANRERGYRGEVFFFYEGLRKDGNRLALALLRSHYAAPADLPFRPGF